MPRRLLLGVFLLALYAPTSSSQGINVTDRFEALGDPIAGFYSNPDSKSTLFDLQAFDGKIYVGHGSTNASLASCVIYFDPARGRFDADRNADGSYVAIAEEGLNPLRVYDGELHVGSLDPNGGGTHFTRKRNGRWSSTSVAPDAHNRDLYKFGGRYFMHHGRNTTTYPNVLISSDDGASFQAPVQPGISTASVGYAKFFEFQGKLYFTQLGEPYLSRYTGRAADPFEPVARTRAELIPGFAPGLVIESAVEVGDRLVFNSDAQLFTASSLTAGEFDPARTNLAGHVLHDLLERDGVAYALLRLGSKAVVVSSRDGVAWEHLFWFTSAIPPSKMELVGNDFYFGGRRSLLRIRDARTSSTAADGEPGAAPATFGLRGNYPNPLASATTIRYALDAPSDVRLDVFNTLGQRVAVLVDGMRMAGAHEAAFDAAGLPRGLYLYRLTSGGRADTGRMHLSGARAAG